MVLINGDRFGKPVDIYLLGMSVSPQYSPEGVIPDGHGIELIAIVVIGRKGAFGKFGYIGRMDLPHVASA